MAINKLGFLAGRLHIAVRLIIFSTTVLLFGCGSGSRTTPDSSVVVSTDSQTISPKEADVPALDADLPKTAEAPVSDLASSPKPEGSASKPIEKPPVLESANSDVAITYTARSLTAPELEVIEADLKDDFTPSRTLIADQNFAINLSDVGEVFFVASEADGKLFLDWKSPTSEGGYFSLPVDKATPNWSLLELKAVSFGDFNSDGVGPDVIAIAEYVTGIGSSGSQPFPVTTAYFQQSLYTHATFPDLNQVLSDNNVETIERAVAVIDANLSLISP